VTLGDGSRGRTPEGEADATGSPSDAEGPRNPWARPTSGGAESAGATPRTPPPASATFGSASQSGLADAVDVGPVRRLGPAGEARATAANLGLDPELTREGPLDRTTAARLLTRADELLASADFAPAAAYYQRVIGASPDPEQTAAGLFGLGMARYRLDQDDLALATWEQILALPETPFTYRAWREIAGARVRNHDLGGATKAYREAQRRAPAQDRGEIASRLGWLAKETGDDGTARRYFARSRGDTAPPYLTYGLIAITCIVSILAFQPGNNLGDLLELDRGVAQGEYWRLWTVTLVHANYLHLFFNMYALYLAGMLVEQLYGSATYLFIYLVAAAAGSAASFLFGGGVPSVGASGAIFGLFGVLAAVSRIHHPVLDRRGQALLGQMGFLIVINLVFSFLVPGIDISAHIGGLIAGLWLGLILPPTRVATLSSFWQRPTGTSDLVRGAGPGPGTIRALGVLALIVVIAGGVVVGSQNSDVRPRRGAVVQPPTAIVLEVGRVT
jgi:rhomboid protease GluP